MSKLNDQKDNGKDKEIKEDDAINEALSALGWIEEKESASSVDRLKEQAQLIERLNKKILELQKQNQELDVLIKADSQTRNVESIQKDFTQKISHLQERLDQLKVEKDEFMFKLGEVKKENQEIVRSYEIQIEQLNAQNQALLNRTALNQSFDDEIAIMTAEKQELIRENTHLREENTINITKIKDLEQLNKHQQSELIKFKTDTENKTGKFKELIQELEGYKNEFVNLKNKIADLERKNHSLTNELSQKQYQISEESNAVSSYKEQIANKEAIIKDLQNEITGYSEQIQYMEADTVKRSDYEELKRIIANKDQVITTKEKSIFEMEKKTEDLQKQTQNTENMLKDLKQKLSQKGESDTEMANLTKEIHTLSQSLTELEQQKQVLYDQIKKLKEKETGDLAIIHRLENQIEQMRSSIIKENLEMDTLRKQQQEYEAQLKEFRKNLEEKDKIDGKVDRKLKEMREANEKEVQSLQNEIMEHKKRIKILRRDLENKR